MSKRSAKDSHGIREDKMNAVHALAEPGFAKDPLIRLNARAFGLLIAAYNILYSISVAPLVISAHPKDPWAPVTVVQVLAAALLPQVLATVGGLWMLLGDARGKLLVVLSLALGLAYGVADLAQMARVLTGEGPILFAIGLPMLISWSCLLYYLVATSQYGADPRRWRAVLSTTITLCVVVGALIYGGSVLLG